VGATGASSTADEGGGDPALAVSAPPLVVARLTTALLGVGLIRIALGLLFLLVAAVVGPDARLAVSGFCAGTFLLAFAALVDPRRRFVQGRKPVRRPEGSVLAPAALVAWRAMFPSTVGVSGLTIVSLAIASWTLAALLAGALAGIGIAALVSWVRVARAERRAGVEYVRFLTDS